jgi:Spy/CpxP family protein refolding chaperone
MKKNFFRTAIMSLVLACGVSVANAQMPGGGQMPSPEEMAKFQADQMKQTVNLSDDQYNKVVVVYKEGSEKMQKAFQEGGQPDFRAMMEEQNKKLKEILTPEQFKKWDEHQQEMRRNMGGGGF